MRAGRESAFKNGAHATGGLSAAGGDRVRGVRLEHLPPEFVGDTTDYLEGFERAFDGKTHGANDGPTARGSRRSKVEGRNRQPVLEL
ncbi:hypothetical protein CHINAEXTREME_06885 [Halobiforma lacisalsi AJ5]|uniref:Uncharacterized protein n=1 Tax=Natronobacterium lacisalsi AJ5 TaxID=358396 RepID=A0A1P8LP03_NATLA|nr:hypothetical protein CHINAEXTREME_06885 [Halobiforma lacisalsi AJ5]